MYVIFENVREYGNQELPLEICETLDECANYLGLKKTATRRLLINSKQDQKIKNYRDRKDPILIEYVKKGS